jgi:esterase/lipase superfamily enzyme
MHHFRTRVHAAAVRGSTILLLSAATGCSTGPGPYRLEMMPPPALYVSGGLPSPDERHPELRDGRLSIPYATSREPAAPEDAEPLYLNRRGSALRLGVADVGASSAGPGPLLLEVRDANELGVLPATASPFGGAGLAAHPEGPRDFAALVDRSLLDGPGRDVYIYVHGYKVIFENAVAVSAELWHYLDYEGAFVAFAWPATPRRLAYLGDLETAETAAIVLRHFLRYLASDTQARRIHLIGYSAGTRVVIAALAGLAASRAGNSAEEGRCCRIGQVVLLGSDMDRELMALQLAEGVTDLVDGLSLYVSSKDRALTLARRLYGRERAGEAFAAGQPSPEARAWLAAHPELAIIDVTDAAGSTDDNGHRYFRKSPWVSSDMLVTLRFGLDPAARGLARNDGSPMWHFPPDYVQRLAPAVSAARESAPAP